MANPEEEDFEFDDLEWDEEPYAFSGAPSDDRHVEKSNGNGSGAQQIRPVEAAQASIDASEREEPEDEELEKWIASFLEESAPPRKPAKPAVFLPKQAAERIWRSTRPVSTSRLFKNQARRLLAGEGRIEAPGGEFDLRFASAGLVEEEILLLTLARAAARARTVDEAASLAGALVPLAMGRQRAVYLGLWPALPALLLGVDGLARLLYANESARPLLERLPALLDRTFKTLARILSAGKPLTPWLAAEVLAKHTAAMLNGASSSRSRRDPHSSHLHSPGE